MQLVQLAKVSVQEHVQVLGTTDLHHLDRMHCPWRHRRRSALYSPQTPFLRA